MLLEGRSSTSWHPSSIPCHTVNEASGSTGEKINIVSHGFWHVPDFHQHHHHQQQLEQQWSVDVPDTHTHPLPRYTALVL